MKKIKLILASLLIATTAGAAELKYSPIQPQTGDQEIVIRHKEAVATAQIAKALALGEYKNITTTGTTTITGVTSLDRLIVSTAGGNNTAIAITDGTNAVATASGAATVALHYGMAVTTGTLVIVVTGTAPNITAVYH